MSSTLGLAYAERKGVGFEKRQNEGRNALRIVRTRHEDICVKGYPNHARDELRLLFLFAEVFDNLDHIGLGDTAGRGFLLVLHYKLFAPLLLACYGSQVQNSVRTQLIARRVAS